LEKFGNDPSKIDSLKEYYGKSNIVEINLGGKVSFSDNVFESFCLKMESEFEKV
jgi:hypothetical protein